LVAGPALKSHVQFETPTGKLAPPTPWTLWVVALIWSQPRSLGKSRLLRTVYPPAGRLPSVPVALAHGGGWGWFVLVHVTEESFCETVTLTFDEAGDE
jgi:hypothetical protein